MNSSGFYSNLRNDIRMAKTRRALNVLKKRGQRHLKKVPLEYKRVAKDHYIESLNLIKIRIKEI